MHAGLTAEAAAAVRSAEQRGRPSVHLLPVERSRRHFAEESVPTSPVPRLTAVDDLWPRDDLPARLYRPTGGTLPVVLFFHGGGWVLGDLDTHDLMCRTLGIESGCAVLSVGYRRAPEHRFPAAIDDAETALDWVLAHAPSYDLDPLRVAVAGDSAGGNLAVALSLRATGRSPCVAFQILFYPVTTTDLDRGLEPAYDGLVLCREELAWHQELYLPEPADRRSPEASPLDRADLAALPPTLVIAAQCDPIFPQSSGFAAALTQAGVPALLRTYPGMIHGFAQRPDLFAAARTALSETGAFLAAALRSPRTAATSQEPHGSQQPQCDTVGKERVQ